MNEQDKRPEKKGSFRASLSSRTFRVGGYSVVAVAVVLAIIVVINVIVTALPSSWTQLDATSNQMFTLSQQTENILAGLDTDVDVYWIVRSGAEDEYLEKLLDRYENLSSHIKVQKRDPDVYPTFLENYGVEDSPYDNSLLVECGSRYRYVDYNDIYVIDYMTYYYTGEADWEFEGEQALTSAVNYVTTDYLPKLYTLSGHGEVALSDSFQSAVENENFEIEDLSLVSAGEVPEDADVVLVYCPTSDLSSDETAALQDYLDQGGNLILITEPPNDVSMDNLYGLMNGYGITAEEGIVIEGNSSYYAGSYGPAYLLPEINSHTITDPLIEGGYYVLLPTAQGLTVSEDLPENVSVTQILTTTDESFSKVAGYALDTYEKEDGDIDGPFAVGVAITDTIDEDTESNILWVSSPYLLDDTASSLVSGGNQDLFLNALDWMAGQEDSVSIHAKSLSTEYLTMSQASSTILIIVIVALIPLAYIAIGIIIWVRRRRR